MYVLVVAENIAKKWKLTREMQDEFALQSQLKCEQAQNSGAFDKEIIPVSIQSRKGTFIVEKSNNTFIDTTYSTTFWSTCICKRYDN